MSAVRELPHLRLVRPLLGIPKARLVAFLEAERQEYLQDPSNRNSAFERSRIRMDSKSEESESVIASMRDKAAARIVRERQLAVLLARTVALHPAGFAQIDPGPIAASGAAGEQALGRLLMALGGVAYPVRRERLRRLREALADKPLRACTLGGCHFVPWRSRVLVLRETGHVASSVALAPGDSALWDRRFLATLPVAAPGPVSVGILGHEGVSALRVSPPDENNPLPRFVYPALPAIRDEAGVVSVPHLGWRRATAARTASLKFQPPVSLFGTGFTVV